MAYTTDTNAEIVSFISRAQSKISEIAQKMVKHISRRHEVKTYYADMVLAFQLDCFVKALDNNYNDWSEDEIIKYIHYWDSKAWLRKYPYVQRTRYNVNINFD